MFLLEMLLNDGRLFLNVLPVLLDMLSVSLVQVIDVFPSVSHIDHLQNIFCYFSASHLLFFLSPSAILYAVVIFASLKGGDV